MNIQIIGNDRYGNKIAIDDLDNQKIINYEVTETQLFSIYNGTMYYDYKIIIEIDTKILLNWILNNCLGCVFIKINGTEYKNASLISITNEKLVEFSIRSAIKIK